MSIKYVRQVQVKVHPDDFDAVFDALPEHYYDERRWGHRWWQPFVSSTGATITVSHLPPLPRWVHMRTVARICSRALREDGGRCWADITYQRVLEVWEDGRD